MRTNAKRHHKNHDVRLNRFLLILLSWAVVVADGQIAVGQTQDSKKDIPTISRDALKAVVLIVVSDSSGKEIKQGSGVVVSAGGKVVTNFHVIDGASSAVIKFPSGAFYLVEGVLAADKQKDVAVLKASGTDFPFIHLGDSDKVEIGEEVVSIGSPLSLEATHDKVRQSSSGRGCRSLSLELLEGDS